MPVYQPHWRLTMSGTFGDPAAPFDRWAMRLAFDAQKVVGGGPDIDQSVVDDMGTDCRNWFSRPATRIGNACHLTEIKVAPIGGDGKYSGNPMLAPLGKTDGGSSSPLPYPSQISAVVSLNTATRGASGRGRCFVPGTALPVNPLTNRVDQATAQAAADSFATLLRDLQNLPGTFADVRIVVPSGKGILSPVTSVRVGDELDTVRSRRNQDSEKYYTAVL